MYEYEKIPITSSSEFELVQSKNSTKKHKRTSAKISKKSMSVVENELKSEYKKYLKNIDSKKQCKKMTFKQFIDKKLGKKSRRRNKKSKTSKNEPEFIAEPFVAQNETPVANEPQTTSFSEPELPASSPETPISNEPQESSVNSEEQKSKSIVEVVSDALGMSKKEGGKKTRKSRRVK
jgi:hypothetical protein